MKSVLILFLSFSFLLKIHGQAISPISMKGKLKTVTVYNQKARMEYEGVLSLPVGLLKLTFTDLPASIDMGSLQLSLADPSVSIENIYVSQNYLKTKDTSPEIARLAKQRDSLHKIYNLATQTKEILEEEEGLLGSNKQVYSEQSGVTANGLQELLTFFREELTRIRSEKAVQSEIIRQTQEAVSAIKNQIENLSKGNQKSVIEVAVDLRVKKAISIDYNLSMMTNGASWSAIYDVRATSPDQPLAINFRAIVWQSTGENWDNVKLLLSTAQPALNNHQPVLEPRFARLLVAKIDTVITFDPVTYSESLEVVKTGDKEDVWSDKVYNLTSSTFTLANNQTIPSDGGAHYLTIRELTIPAKIQHYAVPRSSPHVYLLAEIINNGDYDLQSGTARIFNGSTFIGETHLNIETLSDTLQISLGIDQDVYVNRERRDFGASQSLGAYRQETFDFSIGIRNNKTVPIEVKLLDQIPISTDKRIEINLLEKDNAHYNEGQGELTWQVRCPPGNTETRSFSYRVKYPKDEIVRGKW